MTDPFSDKGQHLLPLPDHILVDIARNEAAQEDYRKLAVEILINRKSPKVKHPDLYALVDVLKAELELTEIQVVIPEQGSGPLQASVTTATVFGSDNFVAHDSVQLMDEPPPKKRTRNAAPPE